MTDAIAETVTDFGSMDSRKVGLNQYAVLNYSKEKPTAYTVNIRSMTCECEDSTFNGEDHTVCKHLAKAIHQAPADVEIDEAFLQLARDTFNQLNQAADRLSSQATQPPQKAATTLDDGSGEDSDTDESDQPDSDGGGGEDGEDDVLDESIVPNDAQSALVDKVSGWVSQAQQFDDDIDPTIVDLEWAELNGTEGVHVDLNPFDSPNGYWDGENNEWADKEAYDDARSAMAEMLSNQEAVEYTGPPEYINFIAADDVAKVVG